MTRVEAKALAAELTNAYWDLEVKVSKRENMGYQVVTTELKTGDQFTFLKRLDANRVYRID